MAGHSGRVAKDYEFHAGTRHGDIHAAQITQESYLPLIIGTHKADKYDVTLLPLESVDSVDGYEMTVWLEPWVGLYQMAQKLYLGAVGGDDADIDALTEDALTPHLVKIKLEGSESQTGLGLVDAPV